MTGHDRIEGFLADCKAVGRSSPAGLYWHKFWMQLSAAKPEGEKPPVPLILAASGDSNASKQSRLREQLNWSDRHGLLDAALSWLEAIPAEHWNVGIIDRWHRDSY